MITAKQAFEIAKPLESQASDIVEGVCDKILKASTAGQTKLNLTSDFFVNEGYGQTPLYTEVARQLEVLGFDVDFYYCDGSQFVDMYTIVSWDKGPNINV